MAAPLALLAAVGPTPTGLPRASAQPKPVAETFQTADGVELNGLFHAANPEKAPKASEAPVVVFLYPPGPDRDMTKGDWAGLAKRLTGEGYHVFQFDWRGHGKSTAIKDKQAFWGNPFLNVPGGVGFNSYIKGGAPKQPLKNDLFVKDLGPNATKYMPAYLNDLAAVRFHLDEKNDNKDLNTSSIYIVGAGDAASLGFGWLTAEWKRPATAPNVAQLVPNPNYLFIPQPVGGNWTGAGTDYSAAVWLTATHPASFPQPTIQRWVANISPKIRDNNPMLFMYAEKDAAGRPQSNFFYNEVLVADPRGKGTALEKLDQTFTFEVKGAAQLQGVKLLGNNANLKTEDKIVQYFAAIQKVRQKIAPKSRGYKDPYFISPQDFGLRP
jgi:pimeloyl-ACP methyl ester carboxylesterase